MSKCTRLTEVYTRVVGFFRPVQQWNKGQKEQYGARVAYQVDSPISEQKGPE